ncbi:MAG: hypothetical protein ACM3UR_06815 [Bacteroidota bacterium]|jgi:hypothetical protein|nr:hypothetical protein [Ignavibacteria bacterium]MCU7499989.1 hypothetical protein [Ignavibacteria bacterium]MCU7514398.1 hypothetical protein [Ignavibacteria bacterium]MCU7519750.1 hypothetical protein [Ignavibacteria bacterium]MCU7526048.1 hypothetical protein [Ignavibacteria bacterium]
MMIKSKEHSSDEPGGRPVDLYSTIASVILHFTLFFGFVILMRIAENASGSSYGGYYVDMVSPKGAQGGSLNAENLMPEGKALQEEKAPEDTKYPEEMKTKDKESLPESKTSKQPDKETVKAGKDGREVKESAPSERSLGNRSLSGTSAQAGGYYNMNSGGFDSTGLSQMYQEPTLKVSMKYPSGWVYMDQQRRRKLDGITFWASIGSYNPPPYIHVEVVEKYIFNPDQYRYKYDFGRFSGYYNDPEELEGQVSQTIYIRTGDDEDYSIKLIMQGHEAFRQFQPVFFAMVRSFRFGNSLF